MGSLLQFIQYMQTTSFFGLIDYKILNTGNKDEEFFFRDGCSSHGMDKQARGGAV